MPNYRNKNRNRNKNKQRNKQQQQQQQQQNKNCKKDSEEAFSSSSSLPTSPTGHESVSPPPPLIALEVNNASALLNENVAVVGDNSNDCKACENVQLLNEPDVTTVTTTSDTVSNALAKCNDNNENNYGLIVNENMGNEKSKFKENLVEIPKQQEEQTTTISTTITNCPQGKVIVHRIICEDPISATITNEINNSAIINKQCENELATQSSRASQELEEAITNEIYKSAITNRQCENELATQWSRASQELVETITNEIDKSAITIQQCENELATQSRAIQELEEYAASELATKKPSKITEFIINEKESTINSSHKNLVNVTNSAINEEVSPEQFKVNIHKILTPDEEINEKSCADNISLTASKDNTELATPKFNFTKEAEEVLQEQVKVIIHKVLTPDEEILEKSFTPITKSEERPTNKQQQYNTSKLATLKSPATKVKEDGIEKVIIHTFAIPEEEVDAEEEELSINQFLTENNNQQQAKVIIHKVHLENHDRHPEITSPIMRDPITSTTSQVKIREMELDESLSDLEELKSPVVSEAESSLEYSDDISQQSDSITEISSSSSSQKQSRKQKRIALETHFLPQMLNPRFLDSISEENSELSDNSENPLSRSASADSTNHINDAKTKKLNAVFPKSSLNFSKPHKHYTTHLNSKIIREEPTALAVAARIQDTPDADESCTTLRSCMSPEAEAAEVVYINSASSSMSDLHDLDLMDNCTATLNVFDLDTDLRDIINKPKTRNICLETLTSSSSSSQNTIISTTTKQQLPEFGKKQNNNNNNNQIINNSKLVNNTCETPFTPPLLSIKASTCTSPTATTTTTSSLADTIETLTSTPANAQLVFAQIEEQISSALDSINEAETTTLTAINTNLSNTQNYPVTTKLATKILETSCESLNASCSLRADNNAKIPSQVPTENVNMNTVRDLININNNDNTMKINDLKFDTTAATQQQQDDPKKLRLLCAKTLAALPYGNEVLEELATVAQNIGEIRAANAVKTESSMPYPLPDLPHIDDLQLSMKVGQSNLSAPARPELPQSDQSWLGVPTTQDPTVLVCLSPSQRSYIQQKPEQKPDDLLDAHQKFMERRGYHEYTKEQLKTLEQEKLAEQQLLQTAAVMKKLRKSITPPPPQMPPPPVPVKSSETATKAQNLSKRTVTTNISTTHTTKTHNDVIRTNDQASIGEITDGEEKKHRLLSIIKDTSESQANNKQIPIEQHQQPHSASSNENNSRQLKMNIAPEAQQVPTLANGTSKNTNQFPQYTDSKGTGNMQSVETALGQMFPTMGSSNIFDEKQKRFSNIESSTRQPFCTQIMETQPKRYSNIETHYYETKKRMENGRLVEDFSTSKHDIQNTGDKTEGNQFPLKAPLSKESNTFFVNNDNVIKTKTDDHDIMSALNLNKHSASAADTKTATETTIKTTITETSQTDNGKSKDRENNEKDFVRKELESNILRRGTQDTYEEFRQRAKAAADTVAAASTTIPTINNDAATETIAKVTSKGDNGEMISSTVTTTKTTKKTTTLNHDHEKLFKEFDDLSKQLHKELETSKAQREQREKSASMFDLNRVQLRQKDQIEEFNKSRHDHMKELEEQIERSMRSRSMKFTRPNSSADVVDYTNGGGGGGRTYEIPIQIENGYNSNTSKSSHTHEEAPPVPEPPRTYQIPVQLDNSTNSSYEDDSRFRRAESMFNLSDDMHQRRQRTYSNNLPQQQKTEDDWSKYASDLGSSENIARPFAKEVEICYQRRPGGIRAPRISASTNDLSYSNNTHSYDQYNAYNVRRSQAPMLNRAPQHSRPQFGSCYSMIERDPNPKYISTTTRRGVSPAPQATGFFPLDSCHVKEEDMRQRRASLPRELHEQQLKYICSKEEELRTEFERLQNERRRLMDESHKAQVMQMSQPITPTTPTTPTRPLRDHYRSTQKLPTLTEDEVFRQQMAEEWLNKVAEREKRRLQNIIKISKITDDEEALSKHKANMEEEFLSRVKERRCKLSMPADSDWESGAESHPNNQAQFSETEEVTPVKIIEGESVANLRRLPAHLREFAKFSNHQRDQIEGGHREEHQEEESSHETTDNSVSKAFKKSTVVKTVKTLRAPMLPEQSGHDTKLHYTKHRAYQIPTRIRDTQSSDRIHRKNLFETRRANKQTRFAEPSTKRRSWSESDLLKEIDKELKLAKGFLFQDEKAQSPSMFAPKFKAKARTGTGVWSPKNQTPNSSWSNLSEYNKSTPPTPPPPPFQPVWTPQASPQSNRKEFRPVHFESPTLSRRKYVISTSAEPTLPPWNSHNQTSQGRHHPQSCTNLSTPTSIASDTTTNSTTQSNLDSTEFVSRSGLPKSISDKIKTFERSASASDLYTRPQIKRLTDRGRPLCKPNEVIYNVKHEYMSEPETDNERPRKMAQLGRRQYDGIGPITNDGMPIILRSEVKEPHQHEWYKRLYQTIHKQKHGGRNTYNKPNGYQSEPEPNYDSDYSTIKYRTVNPNRLQSVSSALNVRNSNDTLYGTLPHPVKSAQNSYKNQPGRIEDYTTGHSSVSEKEKKEQFDQAKLSSNYTEGNLSRALAKESGYTSDSNLVFRKKQLPPSSPLSPVEQKLAYKTVQAGGEPPLFGFRKPAPEKSKDYDFPSPQLPPPPRGELLKQGAVSPNRYYESDVNIHFKAPVRQEFKYPISEEELAIRQAEQMQKLYQEERRRKYLQELQDMNSRRHTDNFTPSQKSPISLNRYDDFPADLAPKHTNQVKSIARALYNFQAQNSKELSFKKGDIIYIKRAIDKNWYEGEHNAMIGLFPANYVEIINKETVYPVQPQQHTLRKPSEGQARAKYNFQAQSGVELSLNKGELVALTRRVDDNWFEGRIANRKGIFPVSYVEVLTDIGAEDIAARTTTIQHTSIVNARPSLDALRTNINNEFNTLTRNGNQPPNAILRETRNGHKTDILHVDTSSEPLVYRALYKYRPQNSDELELQEGDFVHVLEKCDDGWYVGTSQRTGCFGTFPGNYVERI